VVSATTKGVKISVYTEYQPGYSSPGQNHYVFTYRVTIENLSSNSVKLLRRHWYIYDAGASLREVEGEGVVGVQPIIEPGHMHEYISGCNLRSGMGKMKGYYFMETVKDGHHFQVVIPEFQMIAPFKLN